MAARRRDDYGHVTMATHSRKIPAGEFKAKCLALLDEVSARGETIIVTKRGKAVARLVPMEEHSARRDLRGSILMQKDLISPIEADWDALR
jgi:prevent-host-death family protein